MTDTQPPQHETVVTSNSENISVPKTWLMPFVAAIFGMAVGGGGSTFLTGDAAKSMIEQQRVVYELKLSQLEKQVLDLQTQLDRMSDKLDEIQSTVSRVENNVQRESQTR